MDMHVQKYRQWIARAIDGSVEGFAYHLRCASDPAEYGQKGMR